MQTGSIRKSQQSNLLSRTTLASSQSCISLPESKETRILDSFGLVNTGAILKVLAPGSKTDIRFNDWRNINLAIKKEQL
jgi:hypothetical protein